MRRRLIATYVGLLIVVLLGLTVPLGYSLAAGQTQAVFIDRLNDTARFASLAEPALQTGRVNALSTELALYDEMFGIQAAIVGRDGALLLTSRPTFDLSGVGVLAAVNAGLTGQRSGSAEVPWPWETGPLIVVEPIGRGGETIGVAVTISPTGALRWAIVKTGLLLAGLSLAALCLGVIATMPLSRWMLRPVKELDEAAHALAEGRFSRVDLAGSGPPELRRLTDSFTLMAGRVTTLLQRQRTFASYASHQLRTPLATLRLCVENLRPAVRAEGKDDFLMVAEEIERMAGMCDALLTYALAEVTGAHTVRVDAAAVVQARLAVWRPAADKAGITLHGSGETRADVRAADQALDQSLDALINNAIKFCGAGAQVHLIVDSSQSERVVVHVVDNGPGMPAADLARAANPFWRRTASQNIEGSGLGLTITEALITACGGRFELAAAKPSGLHARITLPAWGKQR
jgi:signal transduction histidine kinase